MIETNRLFVFLIIIFLLMLQGLMRPLRTPIEECLLPAAARVQAGGCGAPLHYDKVNNLRDAQLCGERWVVE